MSFQVRFRRYNGTSWETAYTFPVNPFFAPDCTVEHAETETGPRPSSTNWTWSIEAKLYKALGDVFGQWNDLRAAIEGDPPVKGVQLLRDGVVVEEVSSEGGYQEVKITRLSSPPTETQWSDDLTVRLQVTGVKRITTTLPDEPEEADETDGSSDEVATLELSVNYSYDEAGLLTKTLSGELTAKTGSAEALARAMGLTPPGADFALLTRGPNGVDVEVLDLPADKRARFTSSVKQSGAALPSGVSPNFSLQVETVAGDGDEVTTTTAVGEGPGALDAVKSKRPPGRVLEKITYDTFRLTASAVYITKKKRTTDVKRQTFTISGGGRATRWTRRTGGLKPLKHLGSFTEATLDEQVTFEKIGTKPTIADFKLPKPISDAAVEYDASGFSISGPTRIEIGVDSSGDKWQVVVRRRYTSATFYDAWVAMNVAIYAPGDSSTLNDEAQRQGQGKD